MSRAPLIIVIAAATALGYIAGIKTGEAQRRAIIHDLPETRALMAKYLDAAGLPTERDIACDRVAEAARDLLRQDYRDQAYEPGTE